jgi:hypothetical protein
MQWAGTLLPLLRLDIGVPVDQEPDHFDIAIECGHMEGCAQVSLLIDLRTGRKQGYDRSCVSREHGIVQLACLSWVLQ